MVAALLANPTHRITSGLSPFPEKTNCHIDNNRDYHGLNQKLNRHFATSLMPPNCPTDPIPAANRSAGEDIGPQTPSSRLRELLDH